jgi:hypothetical protein
MENSVRLVLVACVVELVNCRQIDVFSEHSMVSVDVEPAVSFNKSSMTFASQGWLL